MALPVVQAVGAVDKGNKKAISPSWPTHQQFDIALLLVESAAGETITLPTPSGFVELTGSPFSTGAPGTQLSVFWARATSASMNKPVTSKPADHIYGRILTVRGCAQSG